MRFHNPPGYALASPSVALPFEESVKTGGIRPSAYQQAIFDWVQRGNGNAVVSAFAGSGKTTTLVEAAKRLPPGELLFLAFNRSIVEELKKRLPSGSQVLTINGLGHRALMAHLGKITLEASKYDDIITEQLKNRALGYLNRDEKTAAKDATKELVRFAQATLSPLTDEGFFDMVSHFGIELEMPTREGPDGEALDDPITPETLFGFARRVLKIGEDQAERGIVSYDDQIWLPVKWGLRPARARWIFVDECQDLSKAKLELVLASLAPSGRILAVGDKFQAIYGFSGADANSFDTIVKRTNATVLPLSISYRCPTSVIELAQEIVPDIQCAPNAPLGFVDDIEQDDLPQYLREKDLVLCRLTAPLIRQCISLIRSRIPARVKGRDIGKALVKIAREALGSEDWSHFGILLDQWYRWHKGKLEQRKNPETLLESLADRVAGVRTCYESFCVDSLAAFEAEVNELFSDGKAFVELSTIHRAKGLEADTVYILHPEKLPLKWKGQLDWEVVQEQNIKYVALTRSMNRLVFVHAPEQTKDTAA